MKKRVAPFRLRVEAYLHEKIDNTLRTKEERETGTIPASLRSEAPHALPFASRRSASDVRAKTAPSLQAVSGKIGNGGLVAESPLKSERSRKRDRLDDTESGRGSPEMPQKKAK